MSAVLPTQEEASLPAAQRNPTPNASLKRNPNIVIQSEADGSTASGRAVEGSLPARPQPALPNQNSQNGKALAIPFTFSLILLSPRLILNSTFFQLFDIYNC